MRELRVGDEIEGPLTTVEQRNMSIFTLLMNDPNPLHFDPAAVAAAGLGDRTINQGTINIAYPINALLGIVESPAQVKTFRCRFLGSVFAGDRVQSHARVTAVEGALVTLEVRLERVDPSQTVLSGSATIELHARP